MVYKRYLSILVCFIIIFLNGCSKPKLQQEEKKVEDSIQGKVVVYSLKENVPFITESAISFKNIHPKVEVEVIETSINDIKDRLYKSNNSSEIKPDIINVEDKEMQELVKGNPNTIMDLSDDIKSIKDDLVKSRVEELPLEGKVYGFPINSKPVALFYRSDLFNKYNINIEDIKTWDDYIEACKKLKVLGEYAFVIPNGSDEVFYRQFLNQLGGSYFDKDGKPAINTAIHIRALGLMKRLYDEKLVLKLPTWESIISEAKKETLVAAVLPVEYIRIIENQLPEFKGKWKIAKLPTFEAGGNPAVSVSGSNLMILDKSENKKLAVEFSKFLITDKDNLVKGFNKYGLMPAYTSSYNEKSFNESNEYYTNEKVGELFASILEDKYPIYYTSNFNSVRQLMESGILRILYEGTDIKQTLDELQKQMEINNIKE